MNRRQLLTTLGVLGAGGVAIGTGAFTETSADRAFSVQVTGDAAGLLGLDSAPGPNGAYADGADDGEIEVDLTSSNENVGDGIAGGEGVNSNGFTLAENVFQIVNQGTQEVRVSIDPPTLTFSQVNGSDVLVVFLLPLFADRFTLAPGEAQTFSLFAFDARTGNVGTTVDDTIEVTAEAT